MIRSRLSLSSRRASGTNVSTKAASLTTISAILIVDMKKMLTLTDRAIYFGFRVVHSGTMLRSKSMAKVLHEPTPTTFGQQCCSNLNRL